MAEYKAGMCKYLIVMGCLVQRYYKDLQKAIPEVDLWIKLEDYDNFWEMVDELVNNNKVIITKQKLSSKITEMEPLPMLTYEEF